MSFLKLFFITELTLMPKYEFYINDKLIIAIHRNNNKNKILNFSII